MAKIATRGRPQASSREILQDAAFELFLENGYSGTTVEQITQRAGVGRATFFNYFPSKADILWVELDETIGSLSTALAENSTASPLDDVRTAILCVGRSFGPDRVPFALTQHGLIGSVHELQASALSRFLQQSTLLRGYLELRGLAATTARSIAYAVLGATIAAAQSWAEAGTTRGELEPYLSAAIDPVLAGFRES